MRMWWWWWLWGGRWWKSFLTCCYGGLWVVVSFSPPPPSFDNTKFMAGKSMWRGGEFALRRKSQSSDAQKKTSCQRQSRRSQVRSTQRRGLSRTIIFVQERNLGHPASWINSTSKSKVTMQVRKGPATKLDEVSEKCQRGGGVIFNLKIYIADLGPLNRSFWA